MVQVKPWPYELGFIGGVPLLKNKSLSKFAKIKVKDVSSETNHRQSSPLHDSTNQHSIMSIVSKTIWRLLTMTDLADKS